MSYMIASLLLAWLAPAGAPRCGAWLAQGAFQYGKDVGARIGVSLCLHLHIYICIMYICIYAYMCVCAYIHAYLYVHPYIYIDMYTHMYIYTHVCTFTVVLCDCTHMLGAGLPTSFLPVRMYK